MPTTRSTHLLRRAAALAAAPALVLAVAACGGDDDGGGGDSASFCEDVEGPFESVNDPGADPEETIASMREVDPPDEIADDWDTVISTLEALQGLDEDPDDGHPRTAERPRDRGSRPERRGLPDRGVRHLARTRGQPRHPTRWVRCGWAPTTSDPAGPATSPSAHLRERGVR